MITTEQRLTILAVIGCNDHGPCDGGATATCPHCGADGRYVYTCLMSDGSHKQMMKGCLGTFTKDVCAKQCEAAMEKKAKNKTSRWDERVINAIDGVVIGTVSIDTLRSVCRSVASEKQAWLRKKGWR
jgi:hypothetical protein